MKRLLMILAFLTTIAGLNAQTAKEKNSFVMNMGYQTEFQRFGLQAQGRYTLCSKLRLAPDVTFYFPKDQITGLDINVNFHYLFPWKKITVYPLMGIGLQTNFYANSRLESNDGVVNLFNDTGSDFAFNVGGGITYPLSKRCYLNAESKFMIGYKHNFAIMLGYGHRF